MEVQYDGDDMDHGDSKDLFILSQIPITANSPPRRGARRAGWVLEPVVNECKEFTFRGSELKKGKMIGWKTQVLMLV